MPLAVIHGVVCSNLAGTPGRTERFQVIRKKHVKTSHHTVGNHNFQKMDVCSHRNIVSSHHQHLITPKKICSHHQFTRSHRHNFVHTMHMLITLLKLLFTPSKFCSHHQFTKSHRHKFTPSFINNTTPITSHLVGRFFAMYCVAQCSCPPTEWLWLAPTAPTCQASVFSIQSDATCRHHTDLHCSHTVGINNTHIRWNQVFVVWPSYVSEQNKFVWVWSPLMNAKMLHVRVVRPWWHSTAWTVEYSRIQFMHWYSWRDITPCHFSAVLLVGDLGLRR